MKIVNHTFFGTPRGTRQSQSALNSEQTTQRVTVGGRGSDDVVPHMLSFYSLLMCVILLCIIRNSKTSNTAGSCSNSYWFLFLILWYLLMHDKHWDLTNYFLLWKEINVRSGTGEKESVLTASVYGCGLHPSVRIYYHAACVKLNPWNNIWFSRNVSKSTTAYISSCKYSMSSIWLSGLTSS